MDTLGLKLLRPHKHRDPTSHAFWNPLHLGPYSQNAESLCSICLFICIYEHICTFASTYINANIHIYIYIYIHIDIYIYIRKTLPPPGLEPELWGAQGTSSGEARGADLGRESGSDELGSILRQGPPRPDLEAYLQRYCRYGHTRTYTVCICISISTFMSMSICVYVYTHICVCLYIYM